MAQQLVIPHLKLDSREELSGALENPPIQNTVITKPSFGYGSVSGRNVWKICENTEVKLLKRDKKLTHFSKKLQDVATEKDQLQHEMMRLSAKNDVLIQNLMLTKLMQKSNLQKQQQTYKN